MPGTKLPPERKLAGELAISRSTLRQALTTLTQSGHLVSLRGRSGGTFVAETPPLSEGAGEEVGAGDALGPAAWAVLDYRVAIETGAAALAAERTDREHLERLKDLVRKMSKATDFEEYRRADVRFHIGVSEAASSPRLVSAMTEVQGQMSELIGQIAHPEQVLTKSNRQHGEIVKLLRIGDGPGAAQLMREHIEGTEHILAGLLPRPVRPG